ncbi:MAG: segregation/condensation protein A [Parcubacteria group bacterium]|nr:segregation/condensation protein A [Parcubacteria group bacterium]
MYEIKTESFEGPLSLLLALIEQEKLDITTVSLAHVADQYLSRVEALGENLSTNELADFLVVASRLLLIKSYVLLPTLADEDADSGYLEAQIKIYKVYRDAAQTIRGIIAKKRFSFSRQPFKAVSVEFSPPPKLASKELAGRLSRLIAELEKTFVKLPKKTMRHVVSIRERIEHLKTLLASVEKTGFSEFLKSAKNKSEIVISFLALLELVKQRHLFAEQEPKCDIVIQRA